MSSDAEFIRRRQRLMAEIGPGNAVLIAAAAIKLRNGDSHYPYRQDSDFLYLTGFNEPDAVLLLRPGQTRTDQQQPEQILFLRPKDPVRHLWDGPRLGVEAAPTTLGVDQAISIDDMDHELPRLLADCDEIYCLMGRDAVFEQRVSEWREAAKEINRDRQPALRALEPVLHEQRLIKSAAELKLMEKAAKVSAQAMMRAMAACRPGLNERDLHAELLYCYQQQGACPAYQPIVAAGRNALILHYIDNKQALADGSLLLIDAGAEVEGYAADITRTFPINGRFTGPQRDIYELVLCAHQRAIECVQIGAPYNAAHDSAVRTLTDGLLQLGLLQGELDENIEQEHYRRFYMHKTGHWLGLDVHDVGDYKIDEQWRVLERNMVLTIEPGLYIGDDPDIPEHFHNIGIRLEDDIRVGSQGPENLTVQVPIKPDDVEHLMRHGLDSQ